MTSKRIVKASRLILLSTLTATSAFLTVLFPLQSNAQLSLSTVVTLAQKNSTTARLAEADVRKAEAILAETHDVYFPSFNLNAGLPAAPSLGFTGGIPSVVSASVQSQVFSFPQIQYERAAKAGLLAAKLNLKNIHEQVALDASTAYIELDVVTRELSAANQQAGFAQRLVEIEQQRSEAGIDSLSMYLDARLSAANIKYKLLHLESRRNALVQKLAMLTGLPATTMLTNTSSIPEIPRVSVDAPQGKHFAIESTRQQANAKGLTALGDAMSLYSPQIGFALQYYRHTTLLNDTDTYYARPLPTNNFNAGFTFQIPFIDLTRRGKARESAADSLRAKVEAEQAERQNEITISSISDNLRELDVVAEIADLKKQIATEQIHSVEAQLELGNGASSTPQTSPRAQQLAHIDERDKFIEAEDAGFELCKARLNLIEALGHMDDWLRLVNSAAPTLPTN
jgi:outer membrane protein TolC